MSGDGVGAVSGGGGLSGGLVPVVAAGGGGDGRVAGSVGGCDHVPAVIGGGARDNDSGKTVAAPWSQIRDGNYWAQEVWRRGEAELPPDCGRILLARTTGMCELEKRYYGRALFVKINGDVPVTPQQLVASLEQHCGVRRAAATADVTSPPYHFFVQFDDVDSCTRVVDLYPNVRCCGQRITIRRWSSEARGTPGKLECGPCLISFDGLTEEVQEPQAANLLVAGLNGELIEMLPAKDRWVVPLKAWLRDLNSVPKQLTVTVSACHGPLAPPSSDSEADSYGPSSPTRKLTRDYSILVHVKETVDRGPLLMDGSGFYPDEDEDLSRRHKFQTWRGKIDGTGPSDYGEA